MTSVAELCITGPTEPWQTIGLTVVDDVASIGGIRIRFVAADGPTRIESWTLVGSATSAADIDGLLTIHMSEPDAHDSDAHERRPHPLGVAEVDHLVVMTSALDRTCGAIERATGEPVKRVREVGPIRQGFHRFGSLIIEVVETAQVTDVHASFWGFVLNVDDIHDAADRLGPELLSPPKPAVQQGRLISSFRAAAGLGLPIALMSR